MGVLLLFCLPLIFLAYAFQLEEKNKHFLLFFAGIFTAVPVFLLISSFFPRTDIYATLKTYLFYSFFVDTLIPVCIVTIIAFLFSGFSLVTAPAALFGLFTVKIYQQLFLMSAYIRIMPLILSLIVYAGALLFFDALVRFCADITFYCTPICFLCFLLFIGVLATGFVGIGLQYFGGNNRIYIAIFGSIASIGMILHLAVYGRRVSD